MIIKVFQNHVLTSGSGFAHLTVKIPSSNSVSRVDLSTPAGNVKLKLDEDDEFPVILTAFIRLLA